MGSQGENNACSHVQSSCNLCKESRNADEEKLMDFLKAGCKTCVEKFLQESNASDLFKSTPGGGTCLHAIVTGGRSDLLKYLLSSRGSLCQNIADQHDAFGNTVLHLAIRRNRLDLVEQLIRFQPTLCYSRNRENETPLFLAVRLGVEDVVKVLVNAAPDSLLKLCGNNKNVLHLAAELHLVRIVSLLTKHKDENLKKIINHGAGLPLPDRDSISPEQQTHSGARGNESSEDGKEKGEKQQCHSVACGSQSSQKGKEKGDADGEDTTLGDTPLHIAARKKSLHMVNTLLDVPGVDRYAMNHVGLTPLDISKEETEYFERYKIISKLSDHPAGHRPFMYNSPFPSSKKLKNANELLDKIYKDRQNAEIVVATLLASMTFTAVFQVPGGLQTQHTDGIVVGAPTFIGSTSFKLFIIFDCVAFFLSLFVVFMWQISSELTTADKMLFMCINNLLVCFSFAFTAFGFIAAVYVMLAHKLKVFSIVVFGSMAFIVLVGWVASWHKAATFSVTRAKFNRLCGVPCWLDDVVEFIWLVLEKRHILEFLRELHEWLEKCFVLGLRHKSPKTEAPTDREGGCCSSSPMHLLCKESQYSV